MDMCKIMECDISDCAYNRDQECHAMAITVGDNDPVCDTYMQSAQKGGADTTGCVGACKITRCEFNESLECTAGSIQVGRHSNSPECLTYNAQ